MRRPGSGCFIGARQERRCEQTLCRRLRLRGGPVWDHAASTVPHFDGKDLSAQLDWKAARRPNVEMKRVNVDFPAWVVSGLDREAERLGVTRQALIKVWIAERLARRP